MAKKPTSKPAPKPARKPAPKAPALSRPSANPLDAVRNPNFGAALAQQDYFNNLSRLVAERNARGAEYNLMPIGNTGATGGSAYNQTPPIATRGTALPPEFFNLAPAYDVSKLISNYQAQKDAPGLMPIGQFSPEQMQSLSPERRMALEQRMSVQQNPSLSQMQDYNRMLQQGIQNSNTMNQGTTANFANMQPGIQAPQQARVATPNPAMPRAGMEMQQLGQVPAQRKLSTFNNTPARFG